MSYAIRNDGAGWRAVNGPEDVGPDETYSETQPDPTCEDRRSEILAELTEIDVASGRPARAVALAMASGNTPSPDDVNKLEALEGQAVALRAELASLEAEA